MLLEGYCHKFTHNEMTLGNASRAEQSIIQHRQHNGIPSRDHTCLKEHSHTVERNHAHIHANKHKKKMTRIGAAISLIPSVQASAHSHSNPPTHEHNHYFLDESSLGLSGVFIQFRSFNVGFFIRFRFFLLQPFCPRSIHVLSFFHPHSLSILWADVYVKDSSAHLCENMFKHWSQTLTSTQKIHTHMHTYMCVCVYTRYKHNVVIKSVISNW